ncbi:hypothetical protein Sulku_1344 [Sulfuricurvum kujiense DSM 16994]|uniref:Uncharacterized protein n=1 Tax=Sulfuricurvum kujiense (strain ATCC BAA-921 / DSM 16994 / JCM 11577 / YK-1) TaxID=709032 RepID=E4TY87_SULKY|nr:hypothetical protein [Sulfuricurvum kujiense]ADR34007.1 hypothetical protein Sulku_1344 [Sulfuricurvum kujiense DSM 16994]
MEISFSQSPIQFSSSELDKVNLSEQLSNALDFLNRTDHKVLPDYEPSSDEYILEIAQQRIEARRFIRENKNV